MAESAVLAAARAATMGITAALRLRAREIPAGKRPRASFSKPVVVAAARVVVAVMVRSISFYWCFRPLAGVVVAAPCPRLAGRASPTQVVAERVPAIAAGRGAPVAEAEESPREVAATGPTDSVVVVAVAAMATVAVAARESSSSDTNRFSPRSLGL